MGWASAGGIFCPMAQALIDRGVDGDLKTFLCEKLIKILQESDWDTEHESLDEFADDPAIVEAFRRRGVYVNCDEEDPEPDGWARWCRLEENHDGDHDNKRGRTWPKAPVP